MNNSPNRKIIFITIIGIATAYLMIYRKSILHEFRFAYREWKWRKEEPQGKSINGLKNGEWRTYFKNGKLADISDYLNDTLHGPSISYTPEGLNNGRCSYYHGILSDSIFLYHSNGRINYVNYRDKNGVSQGIFKVFYENGQLSQIGKNVDGKFDGEFRTFFESGELKTIEFYKMGERIGTWISLSKTGDTTKVEKY